MRPASSIIVEHTTNKPAEDMLVAGQLLKKLKNNSARHSPLAFFRIRDKEGALSIAGNSEHVTGYGALVANGFLWIERALGRPVGPIADEVLSKGFIAKTPQVICLNYNLFTNWSISRLYDVLEMRAPGALWVRVETEGDRFKCKLSQNAQSAGFEMGSVTQDEFLHPSSEFSKESLARIREHLGVAMRCQHSDTGAPSSNMSAPPKKQPSPRIVVIGEEKHLRSVYPAVLVSLGDSVHAMGLELSLDILSAHEVKTSQGFRRLLEADGILLPGGSDMTQTEGQIQSAIVALKDRIPILGQCLGMQSLVVAVARHGLSLADADLEEVRPQASTLIFTRMIDEDGKSVHRLGLHPSVLAYPSVLQQIYLEDVITQRMHHRYHLNRHMVPPLEKAGLRMSARSQDLRIVDGVEFADHPFCIGLEGHPELSSLPARPNPAISEFVRQALRHKKDRPAPL